MCSCDDVAGVPGLVNRNLSRHGHRNIVVVVGTLQFIKCILWCSVFTHASYCLSVCFPDVAVIAATALDRVDNVGLHVFRDRILVAAECLDGCRWFGEEADVQVWSKFAGQVRELFLHRECRLSSVWDFDIHLLLLASEHHVFLLRVILSEVSAESNADVYVDEGERIAVGLSDSSDFIEFSRQ